MLTRSDEHSAEYLAALATHTTGTTPVTLSRAQLQERIATLRERHQYYTQLRTELAQTEQTQVSLTNPDSRLMRVAQGRQVCYNVQIAVDSKHKLSIAYDVVSDVTDNEELLALAQAAKAKLGAEQLTVVADSGCTNAPVKPNQLAQPPVYLWIISEDARTLAWLNLSLTSDQWSFII